MTLTKPVPSLKHRSSVIAALVVTTALCSCMVKKPVEPEPVMVAEPESIAVEVKRLSDLIDETEDPVAKSDLYEARARLRVRVDNSKPDYKGALKDFNESLKLDPGRENNADILAWIAVLNRLEAAEKETIRYKTRNQKARQLNISLKEQVAELEKQENSLRESIKELQSLELQIEERRRELK